MLGVTGEKGGFGIPDRGISMSLKLREHIGKEAGFEAGSWARGGHRGHPGLACQYWHFLQCG